MLPHVDPHDRQFALEQWRILVGQAAHREATRGRLHEPRPATAKLPHRRRLERGSERIERAEVARDHVGQLAGGRRRRGGSRSQQIPEQRVVGMATTVVANRRLHRRRPATQPHEQLTERVLVQHGLRFERLVEVRHVRRVMTVVMNAHRLRIDRRLHGIVGIRQRRQRERVLLVEHHVGRDWRYAGRRCRRGHTHGDHARHGHTRHHPGALLQKTTTVHRHSEIEKGSEKRNGENCRARLNTARDSDPVPIPSRADCTRPTPRASPLGTAA